MRIQNLTPEKLERFIGANLMTQKSFAEASGLTHAMINKFVRHNQGNDKTKQRICDAMTKIKQEQKNG